MEKQHTQANHYVPQSFLKRWAGDDGRLWVSRILVPDERMPLWKRASARGVAKHQNLYTRSVAGIENDDIERWLNEEFETPAQASIERAVTDQRLSVDDWHRIIKFLAAQDVRTPAKLHEAMRRWDKTLQPTIQEILEDSVKTFEAAKANGTQLDTAVHPHAEYFPIKITKELLPGADFGTLKVQTIAGRGLWLFSLRHLLTSTVSVLLKHKWTILKCPENMKWLTTDDPVVKLNYYSVGKYDLNGGWGNNGTEIFMPLGPRHLIFTRVGGRPPERGTVLLHELALQLQRFLLERAHRFVFAAEPDNFLNEVRPRHVSREIFEAEARQWAAWHDDQLRAERDLLGSSILGEERSSDFS